MTPNELIEESLDHPDWESRVDVSELTLDGWLNLARLLKRQRHPQHFRIVARIQVLVVESGLITDEDFVERLYEGAAF